MRNFADVPGEGTAEDLVDTELALARETPSRRPQWPGSGSLSRFTDEPTLDIAKAGVKAGAATNEWERFANMAEARTAARPLNRKTTQRFDLLALAH